MPDKDQLKRDVNTLITIDFRMQHRAANQVAPSIYHFHSSASLEVPFEQQTLGPVRFLKIARGRSIDSFVSRSIPMK